MKAATLAWFRLINKPSGTGGGPGTVTPGEITPVPPQTILGNRSAGNVGEAFRITELPEFTGNQANLMAEDENGDLVRTRVLDAALQPDVLDGSLLLNWRGDTGPPTWHTFYDFYTAGQTVGEDALILTSRSSSAMPIPSFRTHSLAEIADSIADRITSGLSGPITESYDWGSIAVAATETRDWGGVVEGLRTVHNWNER